ncbi:MAG: acyl-CoA synthase [Dactylosporangium sp.]|nr:SCP2 sterol-binding domain-containing protein [Dactylosporangium sp.]NNJ60865.1 acyl-CoA synthase [Dactylosporangium sp.]
MTEFDAERLSGLTPLEFARLVKRAPHAKLSTVMQSEYRSRILNTIFEEFPTMFRADRAEGTSAVVHWHITGRPDGGVDAYQITIAEGTCTVTTLADPASPPVPPRLKVTMGGVEFLQLIAGITNPAVMFMMGKIKAKGDISLAATIVNLFEMPRI